MKRITEKILLESRWLLVPFYLGLIVAQCLYCIKFVEHLAHVFMDFGSLDDSGFMLLILSLVDMVMIANLIKMIVNGSYQTFVSKIEADHSEKIGSGMLKVKMCGSLIGISGIHLLQAFINAETQTWKAIVIKITIHVVFLLSAMGLAWIDYIHHKDDKPELSPSH